MATKNPSKEKHEKRDKIYIKTYFINITNGFDI